MGAHIANPESQPAVLSIAGSDSGGGAGIQADLKTFEALGVFGASAITCLTAQNPDTVAGIEAVSPDMVALQIKTVSAGFPVCAAKTGMLYSAEIIGAVARCVRACRIPNLVVDPVMVATSGARLLKDDAVEALGAELIPLAALVTPNVDEAEILCGYAIKTRDDQTRAARDIGERFGVACVVKGGHLLARQGSKTSDSRCPTGGSESASESFNPETEIANVLYEAGRISTFTIARVDVAETHGTGCTFSAAVAACLGRGDLPTTAVRKAGEFVAGALSRARPVGAHHPLGFSTTGIER